MRPTFADFFGNTSATTPKTAAISRWRRTLRTRARYNGDRVAEPESSPPAGRPPSPLRLARSPVKTARTPPLRTRLRASSFRKGSELVPVSRSTRSGAPEWIPRNGIHAGWTGSQSRFYTSEPHPMRNGEAQAGNKVEFQPGRGMLGRLHCASIHSRTRALSTGRVWPPPVRTTSWNARRSKRAPSRCSASVRNARISS